MKWHKKFRAGLTYWVNENAWYRIERRFGYRGGLLPRSPSYLLFVNVTESQLASYRKLADAKHAAELDWVKAKDQGAIVP